MKERDNEDFQAFLHYEMEVFFRWSEDDFTAKLFEGGTLENQVDELNLKRISKNQLEVYLRRTWLESIPQSIIQAILVHFVKRLHSADLLG